MSANFKIASEALRPDFAADSWHVSSDWAHSGPVSHPAMKVRIARSGGIPSVILSRLRGQTRDMEELTTLG
jgi:hypothetical protein